VSQTLREEYVEGADLSRALPLWERESSENLARESALPLLSPLGEKREGQLAGTVA